MNMTVIFLFLRIVSDAMFEMVTKTKGNSKYLCIYGLYFGKDLSDILLFCLCTRTYMYTELNINNV